MKQNYFMQMIQKWGTENFIPQIRPDKIQKSARERIFREMVRGEIDYTEYGHYYLEPKFLENLIVSANSEQRNNAAIYNALRFYDLTYPGNIDVIRNMSVYASKITIFNVLLDRLFSVKMTGDIGYLADVQFILKDYRNFV